jgi:hypothetical protein
VSDVAEYLARRIWPGEILTARDGALVARAPRFVPPGGVPYVIMRNDQIAAVLVDGALKYSHADDGVVSEPCNDVGTAIDRMRELIGDKEAA